MYAVVQTGGKQYRVAPGDYITVERLPGMSGDKVQLSDILLVENDGKVTVGSPFVQGSSITATIVDQNRAKKIIVFKKKRRQNYRRKNGHRQLQTILHVSEIAAEGKTVKSEKAARIMRTEAAAPAEKKAKPAAKKAAPKAEAKTTEAKAPKSEKAPAKKEAAAKPAAKKAEASEDKKSTTAKKPAAKKAPAKEATKK